MGKKPKYNILAGLFGGVGDAASEVARLKEKGLSNESDLYQRLAEISLKHQMDMADPMNQMKLRYYKAMIDKMDRAGTDAVSGPFGNKSQLERAANLQSQMIQSQINPQKATEAGTEQRQQLISRMLGQRPDEETIASQASLQQLFPGITPQEAAQQQETLFKNYFNQSFGTKEEKPDENEVMLQELDEIRQVREGVKAGVVSEEALDDPEYKQLLRKLLVMLGPDQSMVLGLVEDEEDFRDMLSLSK